MVVVKSVVVRKDVHVALHGVPLLVLAAIYLVNMAICTPFMTNMMKMLHMLYIHFIIMVPLSLIGITVAINHMKRFYYKSHI